jgi:hypothetical protein
VPPFVNQGGRSAGWSGGVGVDYAVTESVLARDGRIGGGGNGHAWYRHKDQTRKRCGAVQAHFRNTVMVKETTPAGAERFAETHPEVVSMLTVIAIFEQKHERIDILMAEHRTDEQTA